jgi:predicted short-subunit dehydrogenase-like oxidoreductase (DUF2520 family)
MSAPQRARSLTVGLIGTGRVGAVLAAALAAAGHRIAAATGGSPGSRDRAARLLPGVPLLPADEVAAAAELVLVAVPDDVLGPLVAGLAELAAWRPGQLVVHTSGAHGAGVLAPAARAGARTIAMHPAMTFSGGPDDLRRLAGTTFGVTTDHLGDAGALVADLGGDLAEVAEADRPLYHAGLVVGANHLVTLVNEAADLLARAGVAEPGRVLSPLLHAALDNALRSGDAALTGPVSRGDAGTVAGHLQVLAERAPDAVPGYAAMARLTAGRALAAGRITPGQAAPLVDVLAAAESPAPAPRGAAVTAPVDGGRRPAATPARATAPSRPAVTAPVHRRRPADAEPLPPGAAAVPRRAAAAVPTRRGAVVTAAVEQRVPNGPRPAGAAATDLADAGGSVGRRARGSG